MARDFSGTSQYINASTPSIDGNTTIACWADGDDWSPAANDFGVTGIFGRGQWGSDANGDIRFTTTDGTDILNFSIHTGAGNTNVSAAHPANGSGWHHICGTYDDTAEDGILYIDGASAASSLSIAGDLSSNAHGIFVGAYGSNEAGTEFNGRIAECAIWRRALTPAEVAMLAKGASPLHFRQNLVFYMPIMGRHSPEIELIGGRNGTVTGATYSEHPRVFYRPLPLLGYAAVEAPAPTAAITGTATDGVLESDIVAGGETIIITLTNDTWVASGATFDAIRQDIINGLDAAQAEATGWNAEVRDNLATTTVVRTSDTVVTITLSAQAAYDITATETITVTVPSTAVTGGVAITATPTFDVTDEAEASPSLTANPISAPVYATNQGGPHIVSIPTMEIY